jgi:glycosyltransferase involved in cell wall biosynthesis
LIHAAKHIKGQLGLKCSESESTESTEGEKSEKSDSDRDYHGDAPSYTNTNGVYNIYNGQGRFTHLSVVIAGVEGEAGHGAGLQFLAAYLRVNACIHFIGQVKHLEMPLFLGRLDLYVNPRSTETFGVGMVEAMALGMVPVVTCRSGPSVELIGGDHCHYNQYPYSQEEEAVGEVEAAEEEEEEGAEVGEEGV